MAGWRNTRDARGGRCRSGLRRAAEALEPRRLLTSGYLPLNLVSDQAATALLQDANLVNPWGLALNANGGDTWVADRGAGVASLYFGAVAGSPFQADSLVVNLPGGSPTAVTTNGTTSFVVHSGLSSGPASFLFDSAGGNLSGWSQGVPPPSPSTQAQTGATTTGAVYTGLAEANNGGQNFLYAADFHDNRVDVFNGSFQSVTASGGFSDANLPAGFAPYNIVNLGGQLLVSYAQQDANGQNAVAGPGSGFIDVFDLNGVLQKELIVGQLGNSASPVNAPWGIAQAPVAFGDFGGDLLVGNNGDGLIHAFNPQTGALLGTVTLPSGSPLAIEGLRGLSFGNGLTAGNSNELFFSAGASGGAHGLFGAIQSAQGVGLVAQGTAFTATAGMSFSDTLAVFSDAQSLPVSSFTTTIDWGDGMTTPGTVSALPGGGFAVSGSHMYFSSGVKSVTIQIHDSSGKMASASGLARVASQGLTMTGLTIVPTEGAAFSGAVAAFTDSDGNTSPAPYSATIVWGDGATTSGTVSFASGKFSVLGTHTYADEGTNTVSVTVNDAADGTQASVATTADVADAPLTGANRTLTATETAAFSGAVATYTDGNPNSTAGDFTATIDWGDGATTPGAAALGGGVFSVSGTHTYADEGTPTATVTINDVGGGNVTILNLVDVAEADVLSATMSTISATEGVLFQGAVASLSDLNAVTPGNGFSASIAWGDGTTTAGTIVGAAGSFSVDGQHTFAGEGPYVVRVSIADGGGTATASAQATITAAENDVLSVSGVAIKPTEGLAFGGAVATVSDTLAASSVGFTTTIDWGDGTIDAGTLSGSDGQFTISGAHTYARFGTYSAVASISDDSPGTATAAPTLSVVVADAPLTGAGVTIDPTEGKSFSATIATISDGNPSGLPDDFSALIDWGDGTTTPGVVSAVGGLHVVGSHTYDEGGAYQAAVMIDDAGGATATVPSTLIVADYPLLATAANVAATEGATYSGTIASFADTDPDGGQSSEFTATIDWGDGASSAGAVTGSAGAYLVTGNHVFSDESNSIVIVINDKAGVSATTTAAASVTDADSLSPTGMTLAATEGQALTGALATFTDTYLNAAGDFAASIDWGDGTQAAGVVAGSGGNFTVSGSHTYARQGHFTAHVSLADDFPGTAAAAANTTVDVADAPLSAASVTLSSTEGATFSGTVATFTDANAASSAADFTATINWGDGTSSTAGNVTLVAAGKFIVTGNHVYAEEGEKLPVTVTIDDSGGSQATATSTANVPDAALQAGAVTLSTTEGSIYSGPVATFTDGNPNATVADFTATIDWGDGTSATAGMITAATNGGFSVTGSHTYAEEAIQTPITVTINDRGGSSVAVASTVNVADAALAGSPVTLMATEAATYSGMVATFTDANAGGATPDFTATINWGDGTPNIAGTITAAAGGGFLVSGAHLYADEATRNATVMIADVGGGSATVTSTATVGDAPLTAGAPLTVAATAGTLFSGTLGTFTDFNPNAAKGDFSASIDWGDGTAASAGAILTAPNGVLIVTGSHTYATPSASRAIKITVSDVGGSQAVVLGSAHVASTHFSALPVTLSAIEGTIFSGMVATCDDTDPNPADYAATIAWGDGTTATGTVAAAGGGFVVNAAHIFPSAGTSWFTVTMTNPSLDQLTVTSQANVIDAPLNAAAVTVAATEGTAFTGAVATFTDADPGGTAATYTATIAWGDGAISAGTITTAAGGGFAVVGSHLYAEDTPAAAISVTIYDVGGAHATAASMARVADGPLNLSSAGFNVPPGGSLNNSVLATFTDQGGAEPLNSYTATIDWGDGTSSTRGSLSQSGNLLQISGSHSYAAPGTYAVRVSLGDEGGAAAATSTQASVAPTANQLYVEAAYIDVLARPVDTPGLVYWAKQLDAGQSRTIVVNLIDHSAEYFGNIIVTPAYQRYLGRGPDPSGLAYWVDQMQNHALTDERLEAGFIGSPEFYAHAGGTDPGWVDAMYEGLLGRTADPTGETYWLGQLAGGAARADVAYGFAASRERESQRITDDYMHYLGRQPDSQGLNFWIDQFAGGVTNEQVITGFVASDEYFRKHTGG